MRWFSGSWRTVPPETRRLLQEFQRIIRYRFQNPRLLIQALKHRSYLAVSDESRDCANERLEFLGDAVLNLVSSEYLYQRFPKKLEGELTQMKSVVVSGIVLTREAERLGLGKYLLLSENEAKNGGRNRSSILEDAFEALVGAIYLDGGYRQAKKFLVRQLMAHSKELYQDARHQNYKSLLLEYTQGNGLGNPEYIVREEIGPEHRKKFVVEVMLGQEVRGYGEGSTKKSAEQKAAREAVQELSLIS